MPRERRVQSFTALRSSQSRVTGLRIERRGMIGPPRKDPPKDPGARTSVARSSPSGDSHI